MIPDYDLSINQGGIRYYRRIVNSENLEWKSFKVLLDHYNIDQDKSLKDFTSEEMDVVLYGSKEPISYSITSRGGITKTATEYIEGVITLIERRFLETTSALAKDWYGSYMSELQCSTCKGKRLNELALSVRIGDKNIIEWTEMSIKRLIEFIKNIQLTDNQRIIAENVLKEINNRLCF